MAVNVEVGSSVTSIVRMGLWMMGPLPVSMSKGMFMPVSGVRMSENRMTPSGLNALHGCRDTSTCVHHFAYTLRALNGCRALLFLPNSTCEGPAVQSSSHWTKEQRCCRALTARSVFSDRSLKVGCFLHRSWYTCKGRNGMGTSACHDLLERSTRRGTSKVSMFLQYATVQALMCQCTFRL